MNNKDLNNKVFDCIVVGGGAAGLFFAATLDKQLISDDGPHAIERETESDTIQTERETGTCNNKTEERNACKYLIIEKTGWLGTKILMSGGGHCNITHAGPIKDFVDCYGDSGKKIRRILYKHNNLELIDFLSGAGIPTIPEDDGRVFPLSRNASDIRNMLLEKAEANGFRIAYNTEVKSIDFESGLWKLRCNELAECIYYTRKVVIATGGCSYPTTGSDGKMFDVLSRDLNVDILRPRPSLCPIKVKDYPYSDLAGLSIEAQLKIGKKKSTGSLLFTHNSFSGPAALNISGEAADSLYPSIGNPGSTLPSLTFPEEKHHSPNAPDTKYHSPNALDTKHHSPNTQTRISLEINYVQKTYEETFNIIQGAIKGCKSSLANLIADSFGLPKRLCRILEERCAGSTKKLAKLLTMDEFIIDSVGGFRIAMVTRGGVSLDEVDLFTMELKKHKGIYIIGEALDVDGQTGGYNLQFAYSSARIASDSF